MEIFTFLMMTASTDDLGRKRFADDRIDAIAISCKDGTAAIRSSDGTGEPPRGAIQRL